MASTSVRWQCVNDILTGVQSRPMSAGVKAVSGWPGDEEKGELIWIDGVDGDVRIPVFGGSARKKRDDEFDINIQVRVATKRTVDLSMERLTEIVSAIEDHMAEHSSIAAITSVVSAEITSIQMTAGMSIEGPRAFAEIVVHIHSRLD